MTSISTGKQIANLLTESGKSAADMTHLVKVLGEGSMQKGLTRIGTYFQKEIAVATKHGLKEGFIKGGIAGSVGTIIILGGGYLIRKKKNEAAREAELLALHEAEGQAILNALKNDHEIDDDSEQGISPELLNDLSSTDQQISYDIHSSDDNFGEEESNTQNSFADENPDVAADQSIADANNHGALLREDFDPETETSQEGEQPEIQA